MDIMKKIQELKTIEKKRSTLLDDIEIYYRDRIRGKPFTKVINILQDMPESLNKFDIISFMHEVHFDSNQNEIIDPEEIQNHFKKLCEELNCEDSISFLDEMRSDINKDDLIRYFKNNK